MRSVYEETKNHVGTDSELKSYKINEMYIYNVCIYTTFQSTHQSTSEKIF